MTTKTEKQLEKEIEELCEGCGREPSLLTSETLRKKRRGERIDCYSENLCSLCEEEIMRAEAKLEGYRLAKEEFENEKK